MVFGRKKGNFMLVCHVYWMGHKTWHQKVLIDVTEREAQGEAALFAQEFRKEFQHADAKAFPLPDEIRVVKEY